MSYVQAFVMKTDPPPLVAEIDAFLTDHAMSPITFGREAMRDPHFVRDVRNGRRTFRETEQKVRQYMAAYSRPAEQVAA